MNGVMNKRGVGVSVMDVTTKKYSFYGNWASQNGKIVKCILRDPFFEKVVQIEKGFHLC